MKFIKNISSTIALTCALGMAATATHALPTNLVTNSDFSSGLTGWTEVDTPSEPTCCSGPYHLSGAGAVTGNFDGQGPFHILFEHSIDLTGNYTNADLSFTYRGTGNYSQLTRTLGVGIFDASGNQLLSLFNVGVPSSQFNVDHVIDISGAALTASLNSLAPGSYTFAFDSFIPQTFTGPGDMTLSNISVTAAVPEPTTIALLGLGLFGFAAARRRKQ
jgi:hypothetical protein